MTVYVLCTTPFGGGQRAEHPLDPLGARRLSAPVAARHPRVQPRPEHESPPWLEGFWPKTAKPPSSGGWDASTCAFLRDPRKLVAITQDPKHDFGHPIPGTTTSWAGQLTLVGRHNAYHLGQLILLQCTLEASRRAHSR